MLREVFLAIGLGGVALLGFIVGAVFVTSVDSWRRR
jgi:hypothetical protein